MLLLAALSLVAGMGVLLPQDRASGGAEDNITVRLTLRDDGTVTIMRDYSQPWGWVAVGSLIPSDSTAGLLPVTHALAVEFIPEWRWPLQGDAEFHTQSVRAPDERQPEPVWEETEWDEEGRPIRWSSTFTPVIDTLLTLSCGWGFSVRVGPFESLADALGAGVWGVQICDHGRTLLAGGLTSPAGMIRFDQLKALVTSAFAATGENRPIEAIPVLGSEEHPIHSETTYVDFYAARDGNGEVVIIAQPRGGGEQVTLEIGKRTTIPVFSLSPDRPH